MTKELNAIYNTKVDFGDGAPLLETGENYTMTAATGHLKATTDKALCAFWLTATAVAQTLLALAIAAGGNPVVGLTAALAIAGVGLAFALVGTGGNPHKGK
ncbi:MAG: hypothetical protein ACRBK7_22080 [Acidimicrobiales bacterium]